MMSFLKSLTTRLWWERMISWSDWNKLQYIWYNLIKWNYYKWTWRRNKQLKIYDSGEVRAKKVRPSSARTTVDKSNLSTSAQVNIRMNKLWDISGTCQDGSLRIQTGLHRCGMNFVNAAKNRSTYTSKPFSRIIDSKRSTFACNARSPMWYSSHLVCICISILASGNHD